MVWFFIAMLVSCRVFAISLTSVLRKISSSALLLGSLVFSANSSALEEGMWRYEVLNNEAAITGCIETCPADLAIPSSVAGFIVTVIAPNAFTVSAAQRVLTSVTIPDTVTTIGDHAFQGANSISGRHQLNNVIIPDSVISIGESAFSRVQLVSLTDGSDVISIGDRAFENNALAIVTIPDSVVSIGNYAFAINRLTSLSLGNGVTSIGDYAFLGNFPDQLTSIIIPSSVVRIGAYAFASNALTNVTISDGVTSIGFRAFASNALTSVTIPASVTVLEDAVFNENHLTSLVFLGGRGTSFPNHFDNNFGLAKVEYCEMRSGWPGGTISGGIFPIMPTTLSCDTNFNNLVIKLSPDNELALPIIAEQLTSPFGAVLGVPANATAVALNVTVVTPSDPGFITVWPCGVTRPLASNLNFIGGDVVPNRVIASIGSNGSVCFYSSSSTDIIVDVAGWFEDSVYTGATPARLVDTRDNTGGASGRTGANSPLTINVTNLVVTDAAGAARFASGAGRHGDFSKI